MANHGGDGGFDKHISNPVAGSDLTAARAETSISFSDNSNTTPMSRALAMSERENSFMTREQMSKATPEQLMQEQARMDEYIKSHMTYMAGLGQRTEEINKVMNADKHLRSQNGSDLEIV